MMNESKVAGNGSEILEKMGRNLLLFQRIEFVLKAIVELGQTTVSSEESGITAAPSSSFAKQSLGLLKAWFAEKHCGEKVNTGDPKHEDDEAIVALGFNLGNNGLPDRLSEAVSERNHFVHHFLTDYRLASEEGRAKALADLDHMHERWAPLLKELVQLHERLREGFLAMFDFLRSPEGFNELRRPRVHETDLVKGLVRLGTEIADREGWTSLGAAIRHAKLQVRKEDLDDLKLKSATELVAASGLFDIKVESAIEGRGRVFYRLLEEDQQMRLDRPRTYVL